jgi:signal transduction histidine kinase
MAAPAAGSAGAGGSRRRARLLGWDAYLAVGLSALVLLVIVGATALVATLNRDRLKVAAEAQETQLRIAAVRTLLEEAETGQRGFLLTSKPDYLVPYQRAVAQLPAQLTALQEQAPNAMAQQERVALLRATIQEKLDELRRTIELAQADHLPAALELVQTDHGQQTMNRARAQLTALALAQRDLLSRQIAANNGGGLMLVAIDLAGLVVIAVLAVLIGFGIRRYVGVLQAARDELGEANAALAGMNDSLEATVAARTAELVEANQEIQRFAYIVSHDLRSPLVNIMGFTGELEAATGRLARFVGEVAEQDGARVAPEVREAAIEDLPEAIHFIKSSTVKMDRLIGAILRLSREGRRVLAPEPLDMRAVLQGVVESVRHQTVAGLADITIEDVPDLVADRLTVEQIFSNVIENALKYGKPGRPGLIRVRGRRLGGMAHFEVEDNGRGIAARDRERIFELFRRAGDQTVSGEGIGLAHVRALVRRMNGRIDCESTPDVGTVFHIKLPVVTAADREARE